MKGHDINPHAHFSNTSSPHFLMTENLFNVNSYLQRGWLSLWHSRHSPFLQRSFPRWKPLLNEKMPVTVDGVTFPIEGCGEIELLFNNTVYVLSNALYSPNLGRN